MIDESFPASRRYSGSGLGYHLAAITAGGPAPLIAAFLYKEFKRRRPLVFVLASAAISFAVLLALKDHARALDDR